MLGNSITEGGNWKKLLGDSSVLNRGISGDVTFGVLNRLEEVLRHKPSKIFLLIGINDLSRNTPDEVIIENLFTIAKRIKTASPKTELFIQSILPTNESFKNFPAAFRNKGPHITTINTQLARYADKMKYHFVDLYTQFLGADGSMDTKYATDGLHLTPAGYQHWVRILRSDSKIKLR
jgi:lysophospholipase L1-like esterase